VWLAVQQLDNSSADTTSGTDNPSNALLGTLAPFHIYLFHKSLHSSMRGSHRRIPN